MKIDDLRAFVAVVRRQSVGKAADALHITQPALTRRVQNFEEALGVELLDRSTKPPKPSEVGRRVYEQCMAVLRELEALKKLVGDDADPAGELRLGVTQVIGDFAMADTIQRLKERFPRLRSQFSTDRSSGLIQKLLNGELDAAAVLMPARMTFPDRLISRVLLGLDMVAVARAGDFGKQALSLHDVCERGWILNPEGCGFRTRLQQALAAAGLPMIVNLDTFGTQLQLGLVSRGLGIGLVPRPLLDASPHRDELVVLELGDFKLNIQLLLIHIDKLGQLEGAVTDFGEAVTENLQRLSEGATHQTR
ncbi:MAG: LysR family transcriptional regulator [Solimonas sp.]